MASQTRYWVSDIDANWSGDNWANSSNAAPDGGGPPLAAEDARFDANGTGNCTLDLAIDTITDFVINGYVGSIEFNGNSLRMTGSSNFNTGVISDQAGGSVLEIASPSNQINFNGTQFGVRIEASASQIEIDGSEFLEYCQFEKTGTGSDYGNGGNHFHDSLILIHSAASGIFLLGNGTADTFDNFVSMSVTAGGNGYLAHAGTGHYFADDIELSSTGGSGGVLFGNGNGECTLAAGVTVSVGPSGFTDGQLQLRNVTQLGSEPLSLTATNNALIEFYDASIGGVVVAAAPRLIIRGTTFADSASFEKTGAVNDQSAGGNHFIGNVRLENSGTDYLMMGNGSPDSCDQNLEIINTSSDHIYYAYNSAGNYVAGNVIIDNIGTGTDTYIFISDAISSTLQIDGDLSVSQTATANDSRVYIGDNGDVTIDGDLVCTNDAVGDIGRIRISENSEAQLTVNGVARFINNQGGTLKRFFIGNQGDVTFNDSVYFINNSSATNSEINIHYNSLSEGTFNGPIVVENTHASAEGIMFGQNGGSGSLALGQSFEIGSNGFVAGDLHFENFSSNTIAPYDLQLLGDGNLTFENSSFAGDVTGEAPNIFVTQTTIAGNLDLHKTGDNDNASAGGNHITGITDLMNTGDGYFLWGNGSPDTFLTGLTVIDSSSSNFYVGYNSTGNYIDGDLSISNARTGTNNSSFISANGGSLEITGNLFLDIEVGATTENVYIGNDADVTIGGNVVINHMATSDNSLIYFANGAGSSVDIGGDFTLTTDDNGVRKELSLADDGIVNIGGDLTLDNNTSIDQSDVFVARNSNSQVTIDGVCRLENGGSGNTRRAFFGTNGDMVFNDSVIVLNSSDATNSEVSFNENSSSENLFNGPIQLEATSTSCDGISFGDADGYATLADGFTVYIGPAGYNAQRLVFQNFTQVGLTPQSLHPTDTTSLELDSANWGGNVDFSSPSLDLTGTVFQGTADLEKTGSQYNGSAGGNIFMDVATITNSGSGNFQTGNNEPDSFMVDVTLINTGSENLRIAMSSADNYIGGNLIMQNSASSGNSEMRICSNLGSSIQIDGDLEVVNDHLGDNGIVYIGVSGEVTIDGDAHLVNSSNSDYSLVSLAHFSNSVVEIQGTLEVENTGMNGSTTSINIGNNGQITIGDSLIITNSSNSDNSQINCNHDDSSTAVYNGPIVIESTHADCDGVSFGESGGSATLAAGQTVSIGSGGYIAGELYFFEFTQLGATAQTLAATGTAYFRSFESNWGGNVDFSAPRMQVDYSTFNGTAQLEKTGDQNDNASGGNIFMLDATIINSGDDYLQMGSVDPDTFLMDLTMINSGTDDLNLANNSAGNYVAGDLVLTTTTSGGANTNTTISNSTNASLTIDGNLTITSNTTSTSSYVYAPNSGNLNVGGRYDATITANANDSYFRAGNNSLSSTVVDGVFDLTIDGNGSSTTVYIGNQADLTFNDSVIINYECSGSGNNYIYLANGSNSSITFNGDIELTSEDANADGFQFGPSSGECTLADGERIVIGADGFIAGDLYFYGFHQIGNTEQSLTTTGTAYIYNQNSIWEADLTLIGPRNRTDGSTFGGRLYFEKTGSSDDPGAGGNTVADTLYLVNSGTDYLMWGNGTPDSCMSELILTNTGSEGIYFGYNSSDNYVGGSLTGTNTGSGSTILSISNQGNSSAQVDGDIFITNDGSGSTSQALIGNSGSLDVGGDLTIINSGDAADVYAYVANGSGSTVNIGGVTRFENSGTGNDCFMYLGSSGDVTCGDSLYLLNSASGGGNTIIYTSHASTSENVYNGDIVIESSNANSDGIYFGGSTGSATLADGQTISINSNGYIAGALYFRNFTQVGPTAQTLLSTGDAIMTVYDCDWGGDVSFTSPRFTSRGTAYGGTGYFEKTGAGDDQSAGGNTVAGTAYLVTSGADYMMWGNGSPDSFMIDLYITNTGGDGILIGNNSADNYVGGSIIGSNTGDGNTFLNLCSSNGSTLQVDGDISIVNNSTGSSSYIYVGNNGDVSIDGDLEIENGGDATSCYTYIANGSNSIVSIGGVSRLVNNGTGTTCRSYLGTNGDVTCGDSLYLINSASGTNTQIYVNIGSDSENSFNGDIVVESSNANSDGVLFGVNGGLATLAGNQTISVSGNGFIAGDLYFRNFTQTGPTDQSLTLTGNAVMTQYDASWGGNVNFIAPRFTTRDSDYEGNVYFEKTGSGDDRSAGGNTIAGNAELVNSGIDYFMMGNGAHDSISGNLSITNTSTDNFYFAHNSSDNYVGGDVDVTFNATGGSNTYFYFCTGNGSSLQIDGDVDFNINSDANSANIYLGYRGELNIGGRLDLTNTSSALSSQIYMADISTSTVTINGVASFNNNPTGTNTERIYLGNSGTITFNDSLYISTSSGANNSQVYCNNSGTGTYNGPIVLEVSDNDGDGVYFGNGNGTGTLAAGQSISIGPGGFVSGDLYFRNFTQTGPTPQSLSLTGDARIFFYESEFNGDLDFDAPRFYVRSSLFNGTVDFEKTGSVNDQSYGDNTYNDNVIVRNSGTGYLWFPDNNASDFNGDVTFIQTSTGDLEPSYRSESTVGGDLYFSSVETMEFGASSGRIIFDGTGPQSINDLGASPIPNFRRFTIDCDDTLTLNTAIDVQTDVTFTDGILVTDSVNVLTITDNASATGASDASFVQGFVIKEGNDAFEFPVGDSLFRPISISNPSSSSAIFRAVYLNANPNPTYQWNAVEDPIDHVSTREYWLLDRLNTTSNVDVTLSWDVNSGGVTDLDSLLVCRWNGSAWESHGNGGTTGNTTAGTVTSSSAVSDFSPFTIGSTDPNPSNPLPIVLLNFDAVAADHAVRLDWTTISEVNNDYFIIERSANGFDFERIGKVAGAGYSHRILHYEFLDQNPLSGITYYRLKQIDIDGKFEYSPVRQIKFSVSKDDLIMYTANRFIHIDGLNPRYIGSNYELRSADGRIVLNGEIQTGSQLFKIAIPPNTSSGNYYLILRNANEVNSKKLYID